MLAWLHGLERGAGRCGVEEHARSDLRAAALLGEGWRGRLFRSFPAGSLSKDHTPRLSWRSPGLRLPRSQGVPFFQNPSNGPERRRTSRAFLEQPKGLRSGWRVLKWTGPHYFPTVLALHVLPPEKWRAVRVNLRRLRARPQGPAVSPGGATRSVSALGSICLGDCCLGFRNPFWRNVSAEEAAR